MLGVLKGFKKREFNINTNIRHIYFIDCNFSVIVNILYFIFNKLVILC